MSDFTLTTNLSLKKPAIGGSSDKWGEYINSNLDDVDSAVGSLQAASTSRTLESLSNVLDTTPTTGQLLQYDTANWKAATVSIPDNIQDLTNVTVTSPSDGQVLAYSTSNSRWENQTPGAATIPDGTITNAKLSTSLQGQVSLILQTTGTPTDNQIVRYDSTSANWQFEDLPGGTVAALSDTDVSVIANKDVLVYNSTSGNWVSRPLAIADVTNLQTTLDAKLESSDISVSSLSDTTLTTTADDSFLVYDSSDSKWKNEGPSTARSSLGLGTAATTASTDYATSTQGTTADSALQDLIDDSTPQLGGDLDVNGNSIVSTSSGNINITPHGAGKIVLNGLSFPTVDGLSGYVLKTDGSGNLSWIDKNSGSVISLSVTAADEIGVSTIISTDSNGAKSYSVSLTLDATNTSAHLGLGNLATQDTITESQITDLGSYITASSTDTLTNKSGNISQWTNDSGYLTAETNNLSTVSGTLGTANGGTGLTSIGTAGQVLKVNSGATALEFADESGGGGSTSYIEHSSTISDSLAISSATNRMYIGNTTFSGSGTMAGYLLISHGFANFTSASALNVTGTLKIVG